MAVSLRDFLAAAPPGNQVVAYLTIGDPPGRFLDVASEVIQAGALTLELGFPHPEPLEGAILQASHRRALEAGVTTPTAMRLLKSIAERHPEIPLVAIVQWSALKPEGELDRFLDGLASAGAAGVLPVGLPLYHLPAFAARVHHCGLQTMIASAPNSSRKVREVAFRYCSGGVYIPRGGLTGGGQTFTNTAEFCHLIAAETDSPIIVGIGVNRAADVAEICSTPAKAAAVGTALVDLIARGGSAGEFVRELIGR